MPKRAVKPNGKRVALNMKTTEAVRAQLEESARASGRSLTAQVEWLVERALEWQAAFGDVKTYKDRKFAEIDAAAAENKRYAAARDRQHPGTGFVGITAEDVRKIVDEMLDAREAAARPRKRA